MSAPYYEDDLVTLYHGDCRDVLRRLPDASVHAVVCDPPYDLTAGKKGGTGAASVNLDSPYGRSRIGTGNGSGGFMGKAWDSTGVAFDAETWRLVLRVLKPGGYVLAFGGTRTSHRLACAIEDAGFEIRDSIAWLYGSGFPKSLDVSKAIDKAAGHEREVVGSRSTAKGNGGDGNDFLTPNSRAAVVDITAPATPGAERWQGWGTALKPGHEPIVLARKPLVGTVASNVERFGTGALNIEACRMPTNGETLHASTVPNDMRGGHYGSGHRPGEPSGQRRYTEQGGTDFAATPGPRGGDPAGRWPANVILDETQAAALDEQSGELTSGANPTRRGSDKFRETYGDFKGQEECAPARGVDVGGASRFFYVAKADAAERPKVNGTAHPTVKPLSLMRWLVRLVTPPGGTVLEPFAGSGTTVEACLLEGFQCIAIEREAEYLPLIEARIARRRDPVRALELTRTEADEPDLFGEASA